MIQTKKKVADRVISKLQDAYPNIDFRAIQIREVFLVVDDIVNRKARENYLQNWKMGFAGVDEAFITTWDAVSVVDVEGQQSYIELPATPVALPMGDGVEVCPVNFEFGAVRQRKHSDVRRTRTLMSGNMQHQLGGYREGTRFVFDQVNVGKNFSQTMKVRMPIKDSTAISETGSYPIAADLMEEIIDTAVQYFYEKRENPTDVVRDGNDALNRN
jgi:hypothetical protein